MDLYSYVKNQLWLFISLLRKKNLIQPCTSTLYSSALQYIVLSNVWCDVGWQQFLHWLPLPMTTNMHIFSPSSAFHLQDLRPLFTLHIFYYFVLHDIIGVSVEWGSSELHLIQMVLIWKMMWQQVKHFVKPDVTLPLTQYSINEIPPKITGITRQYSIGGLHYLLSLPLLYFVEVNVALYLIVNLLANNIKLI